MARYVTVAGISHRPEHPYTQVAERLQVARQYAVRAARMGADIIAFPEIYPHLGAPAERWAGIAEQADGPTLSYMAALARELSIYIIWPLLMREGAKLYNASVVLDRQGQVLGIYHKMYPTISEMEAGVVPGREPVVLETDFGRIGMAICFDLNFRPVMQGLAERGAEIVFFSSMYRGGLQLRAWAHEFAYYIVSAISAELGQIVDMSGTVLAEATYEAIALARLNLDRRLLHMDYNWEKMDAILAKYGTGVSFQFFTREAKFTIASERSDLTVNDIIAEFGLEELPAYFTRATQLRSQVLAKER